MSKHTLTPEEEAAYTDLAAAAARLREAQEKGGREQGQDRTQNCGDNRPANGQGARR